MSFAPVEEQLATIRRGASQIVTEAELVAKLQHSHRTGKPLRVKYGIDPTAVDVHLGHTVPLRKLKQLQDLGHLAVIVIGNYTALVGDPSGRDQTRPRLTAEQVERNAENYLSQLAKVIDLNRAEVVRNGDWFSRMRFLDILELTSKLTVIRVLERDDFAKRIKEQKPIYLHECLYPLMQGWDSVQVRADVELGASEQLYNLLCGRDLQRDAGQEPQVAVTLPILVGTDGARRMGKSLGNYIGVGEPAEKMFGKLMSIPDEKEQADGRRLNVIRQYFELLTDVPAEEVNALLAPDKNPKDAKVRLAKEIVGQYHWPELAEAMALEFDRVHARHQLPSHIVVQIVLRTDLGWPAEQTEGIVWLPKLLKAAGLAWSHSDARRLIQQKAVSVGIYRGEQTELTLVTDPDATVEVREGQGPLLKVGKRQIVNIKVPEPKRA